MGMPLRQTKQDQAMKSLQQTKSTKKQEKKGVRTRGIGKKGPRGRPWKMTKANEIKKRETMGNSIAY